LIGRDDGGRSIALSLFGKNIFNTKYVETIFGTPFDPGGYSQLIGTNARRTLGASVSARF
jgi:outer membrane receptor protein involved in Fe transport